MQGRQVAFLAPTTVLAEQHAQTFIDRLVNQPLEVRSLSRFKTQSEQKKILEEIKTGLADVVVGTHRLLQKDISFKNLGLVVVDEEQRFGVRDKERLKKLRKTVDVLALTATPIPRTLQMSLSGIRDLSIISTPPAERHAIKTYLATFSPKAMREAIERELKRGGQVFFVHNRVQDITKLARMVKSLAPQAQVGVAHGQLPSKALEKVMMGFVKKELDVLVCTTIIESGLDIPSANTIIINEADKLGLSQIYQLRGRVGRANQKAYAYLFIKSEASLTKDARKRLKALMDFTHLGAGFAIAMHDLQIRGAGNMLGEAQSGRAAEVGYELYVQMLEEAVARLKGEAPTEGPEPEMRLAMAAGLPEEYVPDAQVRLTLYRKLSQINEPGELLAIKNELEDRFGPLPEQTKTLLGSVDLKKTMRRIFAIGMDLGPGSMKVKFAEDPKVNLERLLALASDESNGVTVYPDGQVSVLFAKDEPPLAYAKQFLQYIGENGN
jgi:transcription-repair coupling factor (superfamily II helicase)